MCATTATPHHRGLRRNPDPPHRRHDDRREGKRRSRRAIGCVVDWSAAWSEAPEFTSGAEGHRSIFGRNPRPKSARGRNESMHAGGGTRTRTGLPPRSFKPRVSTDSTTPAVDRCDGRACVSYVYRAGGNERRRADSNRCIEVLQTSPLATWVRRLARHRSYHGPVVTGKVWTSSGA
jgi:hypothetical protein